MDIGNIKMNIQKELSKRVKSLNDLFNEVKKIYPDAEYYLANDSLHLLSGPSHDDNEKPRQERILATSTLFNSGGGDW